MLRRVARHRRTLLQGELRGLDPAAIYPVVQATGENRHIAAVTPMRSFILR
jgi:hypothetical protein